MPARVASGCVPRVESVPEFVGDSIGIVVRTNIFTITETSHMLCTYSVNVPCEDMHRKEGVHGSFPTATNDLLQLS